MAATVSTPSAAAQPTDTKPHNHHHQQHTSIASAIRSLVPGAVQGATSIIIGHPFDTLKTRMQARSTDVNKNILQTATGIFKNEGAASFYRGVSPPLLITSTKRSLQLSIWEALKSLPKAEESSMMLWKVAHPAIVSPFGAGAIAGACGTVLGCPMNVIKIQTQNVDFKTTRNALTCIVKIAKEDGPLGFYRGLPVQLAKDISFAGCYLGLYDLSMAMIERYIAPPPPPAVAIPMSGVANDQQQHHHHHHKKGHHNKLTTFSAGLVASMSTWTILFPLDTAKTYVQARQPLHKLREELLVLGWIGATQRLYKGLPAALLRAGPVAGVSMVFYEYVKDAMTDDD